MRVIRYLLVPGAAVLAAGALTLTAPAAVTVTGPAGAGHSTYHRPSARFLAAARDSLARYLRHDHPQVELAHPGITRGARGTTKTGSYNWSGYADASTTDGTFTKASGSWTMPKVTCTPEDELTSQWVGLDGFSDSTVEQDGTIGWCYKGKPVYFTWYEMYPAGTVEVGTSLQPGDKISASVSRSGSSYTLKVTDATHPANSFSKTASCATSTCLDTSAEWISERPAFSIGIAPQADYGTWKLTKGAETANGKSGTIGSFTPNYQITMVDATDAYALNVPSGLSSGTSFSTAWKNSY